MAVPQLTLLPDPPLLTDDEDTYNVKADATVIAQQKSIPELNLALTWIGQQVTAIDGYRQGAASSATSAATSATNAQGQVALAAAQVALANTARTGAEAARDSAQVAAAAAGSAAGLPSLTGNAGKFLGVIPAGNGVAWIDAGQKVGDVLMTARTPDASYLSMNGGVYLQSAYPALFSVIGLIGGDVGVSWSQVSSTLTSVSKLVRGKSGTLIGITAAANNVVRSTNDGLTWTTIAVTVGTVAIDVDCDDNGKWIIQMSSGTPSQRVSLDDGLTWANLTTSVITSAMAFNRYIGNNTWVAGGGNQMWRSVDNGVTYSGLSGFSPNTTSVLGTDRNGTCILAVPSTPGTGIYRTTDFFSSTTTAPSGGTLSTSLTFIVTDKAGTWLTGATSGAVNRSLDNGLTFAALGYGTAMDARSAATDGKGVWLIGGAGGILRKSKDNMNTWDSITGFGAGTLQTVLLTSSLGLAGTSGGNIYRSTPFYSYDTATQFRLPQGISPVGLNSYIKAKVAA